jgi:hypothetical protein
LFHQCNVTGFVTGLAGAGDENLLRVDRSTGSHALAGLSAPPANLRAAHHHLIVLEAFAVLRAFGANFRTSVAVQAMQIRSADQELRAGLASVRAVEQQANMIGVCVLAPFPQTMIDELEARLATFLTVRNALFHFASATASGSARRFLSCMSHENSS